VLAIATPERQYVWSAEAPGKCNVTDVDESSSHMDHSLTKSVAQTRALLGETRSLIALNRRLLNHGGVSPVALKTTAKMRSSRTC